MMRGAHAILRTPLCDLLGCELPVLLAGMGGVGAVADSAATLTEALDGALHRNKFTLISCVIGRRAYDGTF